MGITITCTKKEWEKHCSSIMASLPVMAIQNGQSFTDPQGDEDHLEVIVTDDAMTSREAIQYWMQKQYEQLQQAIARQQQFIDEGVPF